MMTEFQTPDLLLAQNRPKHNVIYISVTRDVNKARGVKAKASKPRPRPETCKATATDPRPRPRM